MSDQLLLMWSESLGPTFADLTVEQLVGELTSLTSYHALLFGPDADDITDADRATGSAYVGIALIKVTSALGNLVGCEWSTEGVESLREVFEGQMREAGQ